MNEKRRKPLRTFNAADHQAGRFRKECAETRRPTATIGESCIAKQLAKLEQQDRRDGRPEPN